MPNGLWRSNGNRMYRSELPISASLRYRHKHWCEWFARWSYISEPMQVYQFDYVAYTQEGRILCQAIKAELPAWTVIFFDYAMALTLCLADEDKDVPITLYQYEIF